MSLEFLKNARGIVSEAKPIHLTVWPHFDLFWLHTGRMELAFDDLGGQSLQSGQGVLIFPDTPFRGSSLTASCVASVQHFKISSRRSAPQLIQRLAGKRSGWEFFRASDPDGIDSLIGRSMLLSQRVQTPMVQEMRVALLVLQLGELQLQQQITGAHRGDSLRALLDFISANPTVSLTLDAMAQKAGMSVSHFRSIFEARIGQSPGRFLRHTRMREAARLLRETDQPIKQIARTMRYDDIAHFYRSFAAVHGTAPGHYRQTNSLWA